MFLHVLIAFGLTFAIIGGLSAAVYGVGRLRHGKAGMEARKTQHVLRSYTSDQNDPTGGWADY